MKISMPNWASSIRSLYTLCKLTNQCSCPKFLAASAGRYELKVKLACSVPRSRFASSFAEPKGHEDGTNAVTVDIKICFLCLFLVPLAQYNDEDLKSDYLTSKWHPNKIYERSLCLSFGSMKLLLL